MFSETDKLQIQQRGIALEQVIGQMSLFQRGIPFLNIAKPALARDGILVPEARQAQELASFYESQISGKKIVKFVPASGAATRMFKALFEYLAKPAGSIIPDDVSQVIKRLNNFAFYNDLKEVLAQKGFSLTELLEKSNYAQIIKSVLNEEGLNYGNLPKGLLKFHSYPEGNRTPVEEHLAEGAMYARNTDGYVSIHFTVSPEHLQAFKNLIAIAVPVFEKSFNVRYEITFSVQKPSTDTIAADGINNPFRDNNGSLVFRPGGHGALLDNLADLDADLIFIKNIDNVVPDKLKPETILYKKALAGLLFQLQNKVFRYINVLESLSGPTNDSFNEIGGFIESHLGYCFPSSYDALSPEKKREALRTILNRPIRVCGMVRNTGEPGGGPFWVENKDKALSLQILESSQFDFDNPKHKQIFKQATHFNPVDLVVSTKDYQGNKFNLTDFRDPDTGFISVKSKDGKELKALELPGLWNGAMAFWNTVFVEVPIVTFNPVKSVNDLLRPEHQ